MVGRFFIVWSLNAERKHLAPTQTPDSDRKTHYPTKNNHMNPESVLKGRMAETLVEELLKTCGNIVYRPLTPPTTSLQT
jgi:hypothetical protein